MPVKSLSGFFAPRSVAVVGASRDPSGVGAKILRNIVECGFKGAIYPINPRTAQLHGRQCFPDLDAVPDTVDLVVIALPAAKVESILNTCIARRAKAVIVISAGFAEASPEGKARQEALRNLADLGGFRLLGPNCLGMVNTDPEVSLNATFAPCRAPEGTVGVASQSGAFGLLLLDFMLKRQIGVSSFFSIGNRVDVSSNDLLEYWEHDLRTKVIVLYLESLGNPENFCRIAQRVSKTKPIVILKAGRSKAGARAAASHSAAVIGDTRAVQALFRKTGVIEAASVEEVLDLLCYLEACQPPEGRGVGIITNGGGPAIMLADSLEKGGLDVPLFGQTPQMELRKLLPENAAVANPVDMLPAATVSDYRNVLRVVAKEESVDAVAVMHIPLEPGSGEALGADLPGLIAESGCKKPVISVIMCSGEAVRGGRSANFVFPENAAAVLVRTAGYAMWRSRPIEGAFVFDDACANSLRAICRSAQRDRYPGDWLPVDICEELLRRAGISLPRAKIFSCDSSPHGVAEVDYPLVAKLLSPKLLHKADIGGVVRGIRSEEQLRNALQTLAQKSKSAGISHYSFLVQEEIEGAAEGFVGGIRDPECGPVIVFGFGGKLVQLMDDVAALVPPLGRNEVSDSLAGLSFHRILSGFRGDPPADEEAFIDVVVRVGALLSAVPEIAELDINPLFVLPVGGGASAADIRVKLYPEGNSS